jgi:hypothetical protein
MTGNAATILDPKTENRKRRLEWDKQSQKFMPYF